MYLAKQIAQYVLEKCEHNGNPIANVQLQQILYCIQCAFLKERNERCFADDFEAFGFGLCVPNVYYHLDFASDTCWNDTLRSNCLFVQVWMGKLCHLVSVWKQTNQV